MTRKLKVVHYGIAHDHSIDTLTCARNYPDVFEIVGVCEPDAAARETFGKAAAYQDVYWMREEELLSRGDIDAVFCEGHELSSVSQAQKCIDHGIHVHLDKPGGTNLEAFVKLARSAEKAKLTLQMGYMYRYNPAMKYVLERVRSGALGVITGIDASFSTMHNAEKRRWLKQFPGGTMFFIGCHSVDMIMQINGVPDAVHGFHHSSGCENDGSMDTTFAVMDYPTGACCVRANSTELYGFEHRNLKVVGTKGSIEICPLELPTVVKETTQEGEHIVHLEYIPGRLDAMMLEFARCARGEMQNPYSTDYEIALQKALLEMVM